MSRKWYQKAIEYLDSDDEIQKCYDGQMDSKYGWLIISEKKILFIQEKGFLSKEYSIVYDLSRENIKEINEEGMYEIIITDKLGFTHRFQTLELHTDLVLDGSSQLTRTIL